MASSPSFLSARYRALEFIDFSSPPYSSPPPAPLSSVLPSLPVMEMLLDSVVLGTPLPHLIPPSAVVDVDFELMVADVLSDPVGGAGAVDEIVEPFLLSPPPASPSTPPSPPSRPFRRRRRCSRWASSALFPAGCWPPLAPAGDAAPPSTSLLTYGCWAPLAPDGGESSVVVAAPPVPPAAAAASGASF